MLELFPCMKTSCFPISVTMQLILMDRMLLVSNVHQTWEKEDEVLRCLFVPNGVNHMALCHFTVWQISLTNIRSGPYYPGTRCFVILLNVFIATDVHDCDQFTHELSDYLDICNENFCAEAPLTSAYFWMKCFTHELSRRDKPRGHKSPPQRGEAATVALKLGTIQNQIRFKLTRYDNEPRDGKLIPTTSDRRTLDSNLWPI